MTGLSHPAQQASSNAKPPLTLDSEYHDYIREKCLVPSENLSSFPQVLGARDARIFAEQYRPVSIGAVRAVSGLLLFGPSGTGKSLVAQADLRVHWWHLLSLLGR